jgi:hypothetical protein
MDRLGVAVKASFGGVSRGGDGQVPAWQLSSGTLCRGEVRYVCAGFDMARQLRRVKFC